MFFQDCCLFWKSSKTLSISLSVSLKKMHSETSKTFRMGLLIKAVNGFYMRHLFACLGFAQFIIKFEFESLPSPSFNEIKRFTCTEKFTVNHDSTYSVRTSIEQNKRLPTNSFRKLSCILTRTFVTREIRTSIWLWHVSVFFYNNL